MEQHTHKIPIAVIGSGWVVEHRHIPALLSSGLYSIKTIVGRKEERLSYLSSKFSIPTYITGDATKRSDWLDDVDAVMVGVPPMHHAKIIQFALRHNKHVLTEKPFTTSTTLSRQLVREAKKRNLVLSIVHNFQFSKSARALDRDLARGKYGEITGLFAYQLSNMNRRLPSWYEQLPWGLFFDESPHLLYLLDKFGDGITLQYATVEPIPKRKTPRCVTAQFSTGKGIQASLYCHFDAPVSEWFLTIIGEKRIGVMDIFRDIYISLPNDGRHTPATMMRSSMMTSLQHCSTARSH